MKLRDLVMSRPTPAAWKGAAVRPAKRRPGHRPRSGRRQRGRAEHIIGDVENKNAIIVDDIIDTVGTLCATINALKKKEPGRSSPPAPTASSPGKP
jgi:predicted phosphoribosyltransferase